MATPSLFAPVACGIGRSIGLATLTQSGAIMSRKLEAGEYWKRCVSCGKSFIVQLWKVGLQRKHCATCISKIEQKGSPVAKI